MHLLEPGALALLALVPLLLLLRVARRRRTVRRVSSLMLWQRAEEDGRRGLDPRLRDPLLWLQVLALTALAVALARPVVELGGGRDVVFLFDSSASMAARAGDGSRFDLARERALELLEDLPRLDRVRVLEARARPRPAGGATDDRAALRRRILRLAPSEAPADLPAALLLALADAGSEGLVYLFSDEGGLASLPPALLSGRVRPVRVGVPVANAAITRLAVRPSRRSPFDHDLLAEVANFGPAPREVSLAIDADGRALWSGELALGPGERRRIALAEAVGPGTLVRAALGGEDGLAADDRAYAPVASRERLPVLLVTEGNRYLEAALSADPSVALTVASPGEWTAALAARGHRVAVLDGVEPEPPGPPRALVFRPPTGAGRAAPVLQRTELAPRAGGHPVLAAVDLGTVAVGPAAPVPVPPGARVLVEAAGQPVLVAWERDGRRRVVVGFDLRGSSWPRQASFPVFVTNALRWLAAGEDDLPLQVAAGDVLEWSLPPPFLGLSRVVVEDPHGTVSTVAVRGGSFAFDATEATGVYSVEGDGLEAAVAVNLADDQESDLGAVAMPAGGSETSGRGGAVGMPRGREVGRQVILAALLVLLAEWLLYTRRSAA